jgi:hypothetical protein
VKIIQPYHPRCGESVEIQRVIRGGVDPDLIIRLPDGLYAAIAASWTDYNGPSAELPQADPPLLDLVGLRRLAELVQHWRTAESRSPSGAEGASDGKEADDGRRDLE